MIADQVIWKLMQLFILIIGTLVIFYLRSPLVAAVLGTWVVLFVVINVSVARWKLKYDAQRAAIDTESGGMLADAISNSLTIQQFVGGAHENRRFAEVNERWRKMQTFAWNLGEASEAIQSFLMFVLEAVVMYIAIRYYVDGKLTLGDFALLQTALIALFAKLWDFGRMIRHLYEAFADAKEMVDILEAPHEIKDKPRAKKLQVKNGAIEFKEVSFSYNKTRTILQDMTLTLAPREKVAFVGPSGAGKSTVIKLLMRFFELTSGKILIDGQKIVDVTQDSLRANCHEFIMEMQDGYNTMVGERGIKLSGGERQRVAIARAILKDAPILVLDEATSSLDSESEAMIQDALQSLMKNKTVIVVAHRLSTIMLMDRIVVIEKGRVTDTGTHAELLTRDGTYGKLWSIQAGGFMP